MMTKTIILDTNALMGIGQFKVDVFAEIGKVVDFRFEIKVLDKTIEELREIIKKQKGKNKRVAKLVLEIIKKKKIGKIKTKKGEKADDALVRLAKRGMIVVTQDRELKRRIKGVKGKVMTIRRTHYVRAV